MEATQNAEVIELSLEKTIETKLVQANVTDTVLAALKGKYGGMKLKALDDKESYLELKAAAKDCAKLRSLTVKICKEGRERAVKEQKLWIAKEKEVVGEIATVEDPLDAEIALFDAEQERLATEEIKRQEEAYINRQATLTKMGAVYADGSFTLGNASFEANLVKESSESVWEEAIVPKFQEEYEKIQSVRIAEEKRKADEAAELKRQQDELAEKNRLFEEQQAAFKKQMEEAQRAEQEKQSKEFEAHKAKMEAQNKSRMNQLMSLGMKYNFDDKAFSVYDVFAAELEITTFTDTEWNALIEKITPVIAERKAEALKVAEEKRLAEIEDAKQKAIEAEKLRVAEQTRLDEIKKKEAEEKRVAELEAANDKTKWEAFIKQVSVIDTFEMISGQYRKKMQIAAEKIKEILAL